jgi:hypothetical protein
VPLRKELATPTPGSQGYDRTKYKSAADAHRAAILRYVSQHSDSSFHIDIIIDRDLLRK